MTSAAGPVVLGVDVPIGTDSRAAMHFAVREARLRKVAVHVVHGSGSRRTVLSPDRWDASQRTLGGRRTGALVARQLRRLPRDQVRVIATNSPENAVGALLKAAESASLLVLQSNDYHLDQTISTGSTSRIVAARAACPVVIVRGRRAAEAGPGVVVGLEEHGRAQGALIAAMEAASYRSASVTAVLAWDVLPTAGGSRSYLPAAIALDTAKHSASVLMAEALAGLGADFPDVPVHRSLVRGPVAEVLRDVAQHADLLVIGRHANSGLSTYALGHTARALLYDAPCPLMLTAATTPAHPTGWSTVLGGSTPIGPGY